jgi:spermidine synthase
MPSIILVITFIVALCSLLYELLLAQTLATTMGNTLVRYNITIALYIASLGIGVIYYKSKSYLSIIYQLLKVEWCLAILGGTSVFLVVIMDALMHKLSIITGLDYGSWIIQTWLYVFNHSLIIAIGFLSGLELPLLMDLAKTIQARLANRVLAMDYIGSVCASLLFPLLLLPSLGIFAAAIFTASLNALAAIALYAVFFKLIKPPHALITCCLMAGYSCLLLNIDKLSQWIVLTQYFY